MLVLKYIYKTVSYDTSFYNSLLALQGSPLSRAYDNEIYPDSLRVVRSKAGGVGQDFWVDVYLKELEKYLPGQQKIFLADFAAGL